MHLVSQGRGFRHLSNAIQLCLRGSKNQKVLMEIVHSDVHYTLILLMIWTQFLSCPLY